MNVKTLCGEAARPAGFARLCFFVAVQLTPKALTLLAHHGFCLRGLTFELTGPLRWDGLARVGKMYRVPQAGPRRPAVVGPVVQRGVRPHSACSAVPATTSFDPGGCASAYRVFGQRGQSHTANQVAKVPQVSAASAN